MPSKLTEWSYTGLTEVYVNEYTKNQVCKLFALTDGAVTQDMSAMSLCQQLLSKLYIEILIEVYLVQLSI